MRFIFPSQNWSKLNFSIGVINPSGIPIHKGIAAPVQVWLTSGGILIPLGLIFPSQNWPKLGFSVGVINLWGIPIPKGFTCGTY